MDAEFQLMMYLAPFLLLAVTFGLAYYNLSFGFFDRGLLVRRIDYEERKKTELGQKANPPRLIVHVESALHRFVVFVLPFLVNGLLLIVLMANNQLNILPILLIPLTIGEVIAWRFIWNRVTPEYDEDFQCYMAMTDPANRMIEASVRDYAFGLRPGELASSRLLSGGSIITALVSPEGVRGNHPSEYRLFQPSSVQIPKDAFSAPDGSMTLRLYYQPKTSVEGQSVDGSLVGFELIDPPVKPMTYSEYENRLGEKLS